ncbi:tetratricopeptide (TPR) repeat protein [Kibdelosporangium banguiense]|uniref:Tetratricopeptide (TPR) repeat protein n=1 Tax=Kibdelosporangium banguiense TaxID=1365924 RepID=A0ABS4TK99_9PSEU|nr:NB-ARC domain-containing protein [Kibdelosporangium banguiense]MBP2324414.1 tetratricopeptide (TPR) repeat protein [Kibdelosporangium banguiense]
MRILVLGPVDLTTSDGTGVPLGGLEQKALLVALLQQARRPVPADRATELVRSGSPPASATIQTYVSTLRRAIAAAGGGDALTADESGFRLDVPDACTDLGVFAERLGQAKQAEQDNDLQRAAELYDSALALWRGPALADVDAAFARSWAESLEHDRAEAQAGRARVQAAMHSEIMAHAQVTVGAPATRPRNLPPDVADFTGREQDLKTILRLGETAGQRTVVVSGFGGVGKSALAVHAAYLLSSQFPDGQLFVDLRGADQAHEVLGRLLQTIGMPAGAVPASTEERIEQYRSRIASRRFVIVLDNARNEQQVRPLLPGEPGCLLVITSRSRLAGLGAEAVELNFLTLDDGVHLLSNILGDERVASQGADAGRIVELCGGLPLAIRAAGAKLLAQPDWPLNALIVRLADERRRLDELTVGDLAIRSSLGLNYAELDERQRRAFHLLCLLDLPDFGWWPVVALLGVSPRDAEDMVEHLVDLRLVDVAGVDAIGRVRYRLHDLVQLFGAEQHESGVGVAAAVSRAVATWTVLVEECARDLPQVTVPLLPPQTPDIVVDPLLTDDAVHDPGEWLKSETAAVTRMIERAHELGVDHGAIVALAARLAAPFAARNEFGEWKRVLQAGLAAARIIGDAAAEAVMLTGLGQAHAELDAFTEALAYFQQASTMAGDEQTRAIALVGMGSVHRELASYTTAVADLTAAADSGYPAVVAAANYGLGAISRDHGDIPGATAHFQNCADTYRQIGDLRGAALALRGLSLCHRAVDEYAVAAELAGQSAALLNEIGDELGTAYARQSWAKASMRLGEYSEAIRVLGSCLYTCTRRHDRFGVALMTRTLGEVHLAAGDLVAAQETLGAALDLWTELDLPLWQARTLRDLAAATAPDDPATADAYWARARGLSEASQGRESSELAALSPAAWLAKVRA